MEGEDERIIEDNEMTRKMREAQVEAKRMVKRTLMTARR